LKKSNVGWLRSFLRPFNFSTLAYCGLVSSMLLLASCVSLPSIEQVQQVTIAASGGNTSASTLPPKIQLESAAGTLSTKQSQVVLDKLGRAAPDTGIFERHLQFENAVTTEPLTTGNRVQLLHDGLETYAAMRKAITAAKNHINIETYIIEDDEIGQAFVELLIERQRAGVQVNMIYDSVGSINTPRPFFDPLIAAGAGVLEFNPVNPLNAKKGWELNQRDHRKILIVDGKTVFLGGVNISSVYSSGSFGGSKARAVKREEKNAADGKKKVPWRDTHIEINGPVVASFQRMFLSTWEKQKGAPLKEKNYFPDLKAEGKEVIRAIASSFDEVRKDDGTNATMAAPIYTTLLSAITHAETSIFLTNAYFVPDQQLIDALIAAVKRGVKVRVILPGHTDSALVFHAGRSYYTNMLKGGIDIYERSDKLLHSKTVIIDGVWSSVGSSNLDWRSFYHNDEVVAIVLGTEFGHQMQKMFAQDLNASKQVTLADWQARAFLLRVKERAARLWAYWL
jgi:cardiolipin synthase A/B